MVTTHKPSVHLFELSYKEVKSVWNKTSSNRCVNFSSRIQPLKFTEKASQSFCFSSPPHSGNVGMLYSGVMMSSPCFQRPLASWHGNISPVVISTSALPVCLSVPLHSGKHFHCTTTSWVFVCTRSWANKHGLREPSGATRLGNESMFSLGKLGQILMDCMATA